MSLRPVIENAEELETWIWTARLTPDEVAELGRYKAEAAGPSLVIVRGQIFSTEHQTLTLDPDRLVVLSIGDEPQTLFMEVSHEVADSFFNRHRGERRLYPETEGRQRVRQHQRERNDVRRERQRERQSERQENRRDRNHERRAEQRERRDQYRQRSRRRSHRSANYTRGDLRDAARYIERNAPRWGRTIERAMGPEFANRIEREVRSAASKALRMAGERLDRADRQNREDGDNRDYA